MVLPLALLLAATPIPVVAPAPVVPRQVDGPGELKALCARLTPTEQLRLEGDAVERGEREARHEEERQAAITGRYLVRVDGRGLAFAPYDGPERRLTLAEPAALPLEGGAVRLWMTEERGLPVKVDAGAARAILAAQRAGTLALLLTFDLPDEAQCGAATAGKRFTLGAEPVEWIWLDGAQPLAQGGAAAERPVLDASRGARPRVDVGDPLAGGAELKKAVLARAEALEGCYKDALRAAPALDGVLVVELGAPQPAVSADSTGSAELAACVARALAPVTAGMGTVPIRFELLPPGAPLPASAGSGASQ
ncbi:MAG: hypothetical protein QM767_05320 [Anaeromyxobacter sp.]